MLLYSACVSMQAETSDGANGISIPTSDVGMKFIFRAAVAFTITGQVGNVKRDPFEQTVSFGESKSAMALGGTLGSPSTAYLYDWNMLPIGQLLWEKELESFKEFPPLQAPETYNLSGILAEMQKHKGDD